MSVELKSNVKKECSLCSEVLCSSNTLIVDEDILVVLKFITKDIDLSVLLDLPICESCLDQINDARDFKISIKDSRKMITDIKIKEETHWDHNFVSCFSCKTDITRELSKPLLNSAYIYDIVSDLTVQEVLENPLNHKICESCQSSMMNFHNILDLIVNHCRTKTNTDSLGIEISETKEKIEIKEELVTEDINVNDNVKTEIYVKDETVEERDEAAVTDIQDFQIKQEELDVKMDSDNDSNDAEFMKIKEKGPNGNNSTCPKKYKTTKIHMEIHKRDPEIKHARNTNVIDTDISKCIKCEFQTKHKGIFKRHLLIHLKKETEILKCLICGFQTRRKAYLKSHMLVHKDITETEIFQCQICDFQTKHKGNIKRHMLVHKDITEAEIFNCQICEYQTNRKACLKSHMLVHKDITETEIFKCQICEYQTIRKAYLNTHILLHKEITETEIFKCQICNYQAKHKRNLKRHMLVHKDNTETDIFECYMCEFKTKHKSCLKRHMIVHKDLSEIEILKCQMCGFQTIRKDSLKNHMFIHMLHHKNTTNIQLFKCEICEFQTKHKENLWRHLLVHKDITEKINVENTLRMQEEITDFSKQL